MEENKYKILEGSMLDILPTLEENSFDSCITDPPYELNFMGKGWDRSGIAFRKETWEQVYRVLKPGAYLCAFGGSRTFHRIACAIEDAGFEIRDTIMWLYGSGFPKSFNVGKAVEGLLTLGTSNTTAQHKLNGEKLDKGNWGLCKMQKEQEYRDKDYDTEGEVNYRLGKLNPTTEEGKKWNGYGTCLKPAYEPIIIARKPIEKSVAENVLKYGCGAINIDECRVGNEIIKGGTTPDFKDVAKKQKEIGNIGGLSFGQVENAKRIELKDHEGRFPSNVILTYDETDFDEVCGGMPNTKSAYNPNARHETEIHRENADILQFGYKERFETGFNDEGSASRYFYCAKASKKDRDEGLDMFEDRNMRTEQNREIHSAGCEYVENGKVKQNPHLQSSIKKNFHPTVKPIDLMQYLVRMFTPKGGSILEPFAGSGSTGKATMFENRERNANYTITMIEITHEYIPIIKARCDYAINKYKYDDEKALRERKEKGELNIFDFDYGE